MTAQPKRHLWFYSPRAGFSACLSCEVRKTKENYLAECPGSRVKVAA